jgi:hypothetical protein
MNTSIFTPVIKWIWNHKPDVAILAILIYGSINLTIYVNNLDNRLVRLEELCTDIQRTQLPEIRDEIRRNKAETDRDIKEIKADLFEIKLFMKKIDTYLTTTQKDYKGGE